jgi:hypothetical protein
VQKIASDAARYPNHQIGLIGATYRPLAVDIARTEVPLPSGKRLVPESGQKHWAYIPGSSGDFRLQKRRHGLPCSMPPGTNGSQRFTLPF